MFTASAENTFKYLEGFCLVKNIIVKCCQFLSGRGKSVIRQLMNFEPVIKGAAVSNLR